MPKSMQMPFVSQRIRARTRHDLFTIIKDPSNLKSYPHEITREAEGAASTDHIDLIQWIIGES